MQQRLFVTTMALMVAFTAHASRATAQSGWNVAYRLTAKGAWLAAVYADEGADWIAGGKDIVVSRIAGTPRESRLDGLMMGRFGRDSDGALFAVGSHGAIWQRTGPTEWTVQRQSRPAGSLGKIRDEDQLISIQRVSLARGEVFMAFGVADAVFVRGKSGWEAPTSAAEKRELVEAAIRPPQLTLPSKCSLLQWSPFDRGGGLLTCHDGRALVVTNGASKASGKLPKRCMSSLIDAASFGDEVFASCGNNGQLWQLAGGKWKIVAGVRGIDDLSANGACVVAATDRSVLQYCPNPGDPGSL